MWQFVIELTVVIARRCEFGDELRRLRRAADLNRETLAASVDKSAGYLALLEQGHRRPSQDTVDKLAEALGLGATDRSRLRVRATIDRLSHEMPELAPQDLHVIQAVADALLLFAGDAHVPDEVAEPLPIGTTSELRLKAARHISRVLGRVAERWRATELMTMPDYFRAITAAMDDPATVRATAVNTIDPRRWIEDQREVRYLEANSRAAERGVEIQRLFVIETSVRRIDLRRVAQSHERAGVTHIRWLRSSRVSALADMPEDAVLFEARDAETMFIGHADPEDVLRVEFGERITSHAEINRFRQFFDVLFASARASFDDA